ncbi:fluoride efflux transporter CrcB [Clostridium pasteurianum]|uniref:Fluoride-specific ion channel FluC n=1 Tax=Clostridium pasteurianum BC1 TaxID=86416 RepID=R4K1H3_CLOPA|nr:fluoride efflux transporter CrcB [Clostridium pasteurianum]AGK96947.1 crcB protein [Clostridium pasteurianum BC1]
MEYILVGLGGILGSLSRYKLGKIVAVKAKGSFPIGTFLINITGAFLLGFLTSKNPNNQIYSFLGDGFLGAYTTFSTFMYEGFSIFSNNKKLNAVFYIAISLVIGIIGYFAGYSLGRVNI